MLVIKGKTFAEIYKKVLYEIYYNPEYICKPRGQKIKEITNVIIELEDPTSNMFINSIRSTPEEYLAAELYWYFNGTNTIDFISKYSKFWKKLVNPDNSTVNSNYGHLLFKELNEYGFSEWLWSYTSLLIDIDSRQAILHFNKPKHLFVGNKDQVCTLNGIFLIRDNKLNFTIIMRSQDEILGRTFDLPFFTILQQQMLSHLKYFYPDLTLGKFIYHTVSSHLYERNFELVEAMLDNDFIENKLPNLELDLINSFGEFQYENFVFNKKDKLISWIKERLNHKFDIGDL